MTILAAPAQAAWNGLDSNGYRLSLGQVVPFEGHQADDLACGRRLAETVFGSAAWFVAAACSGAVE